MTFSEESKIVSTTTIKCHDSCHGNRPSNWLVHGIPIYTLSITLLGTNIAPCRKSPQKETIVFQASIFRCENVSFVEVSRLFLHPMH